MKKTTFIILIIFLLSSCKSAVILTHNDVMNGINTKSELMSKFGIPTNKSQEGNLEQWIYDYGTVSRTSTYVTPSNTTATATYNQYTNTVNVNSYTTPGVGFTSTSSYRKYAKFLLDNDNVVRWESRGINEEVVDKKQRKKNILIGTLSFVLPLVGYLIYDEIQFQKELEQDDYDYWND